VLGLSHFMFWAFTSDIDGTECLARTKYLTWTLGVLGLSYLMLWAFTTDINVLSVAFYNRAIELVSVKL
jgi:hypothetical protein